MSSSPSSSKKIPLKSSDGVTFEVEEAVALQSPVIEKIIKEGLTDNEGAIEVPSVKGIKGDILAKVIEYLKKHLEEEDTDAITYYDAASKEWRREFVNVDTSTLSGLLLAANDLQIMSLLNLTSEVLCDMIKGKSPEEVRTLFNIKEDPTLTPEEEEWYRREIGDIEGKLDEDI
ncbi:hypothetical protein Tsubulata_001613 [Turnera subulata]|uniref:SKP1-like protein n=1 Tax=Turnera subulata TaxID=218843 RepID=A0A9Q0EYH3_9ROSI|nr:hypothetical protein Tsubulata_001613 [Turnera subulata]